MATDNSLQNVKSGMTSGAQTVTGKVHFSLFSNDNIWLADDLLTRLLAQDDNAIDKWLTHNSKEAVTDKV